MSPWKKFSCSPPLMINNFLPGNSVVGFHPLPLGFKKLHSHNKDVLPVSGMFSGPRRGGLGRVSSGRDLLERLRNWGNQPTACSQGKTWTWIKAQNFKRPRTLEKLPVILRSVGNLVWKLLLSGLKCQLNEIGSLGCYKTNQSASSFGVGRTWLELEERQVGKFWLHHSADSEGLIQPLDLFSCFLNGKTNNKSKQSC